MASISIHAQGTYEIVGCGQGRNGAYMVKVTAIVKNLSQSKDELRRDAVHGVLFRGFMNDTNGGFNQKPLVADPNIEQTQSAFFNAFFDRGDYTRYVSMTEDSLRSIKVKKGYEVNAIFLVDKETLQNYLEECGIIQGFSNLW